MNISKIIGTTLLLTSVIGSLAGCATTTSGGSSLLPQGGPTMSNIYDQQYTGISDANQLNGVRSEVPTSSYQQQQTARYQTVLVKPIAPKSDLSNSPKMLPNPTISIYVHPHFDGNDQNYVPGHMAYTKMYKETHFALPGEPTATE